nr:mitochodrial transcription termination factor [Tanacetum cinerariifolium]
MLTLRHHLHHKLTTTLNNHFPKPYKSSAKPFSPPLNDPKRLEFTNFLINTLGFTQELATSSSSKVRKLNTTRNCDSVLTLLKRFNFNHTQIKDLVSWVPKVLLYRASQTLEPKIKVFLDLGLSGSDLISLLKRNPSLFELGLHSRIVPTIEYLRGIMGSDEKVVETINRSRWLFSSSVALKMFCTNVEMLRMFGFSDEQIGKFVHKNAMHFTQPSEWLTSKLDWIEGKVGVSRGSIEFFRCFHAIASSSLDTMEKKMEVYRGFGFSDDELSLLFKNQPYCFALSEDTIRDKLSFFVGELEYTPSYLATCPSLFSLSLEKRVKPRNEVLKILKERMLLGSKSLITLVNYSELRFQEFLKRFENEVPSLYETYASSLSSLFSNVNNLIETESGSESAHSDPNKPLPVVTSNVVRDIDSRVYNQRAQEIGLKECNNNMLTESEQLDGLCFCSDSTYSNLEGFRAVDVVPFFFFAFEGLLLELEGLCFCSDSTYSNLEGFRVVDVVPFFFFVFECLLLEQPIPPAFVVPAGQQVPHEILAAHNAWIKVSKEIAGLMLMTMKPEIQQNLEHLHAHEMLKELKTMFAQQVEQELLQTTRDFHSCRQEEGQPVSSYVLKMKGYIDNLESLGQPVTLGLGVSLILISLRKEYDGFVHNYNMYSMGKTVNELHATLKLHDQTLPKSNAPALHAIRAGKVQKGNKHKKSQSQTAAKGQNHRKGKISKLMLSSPRFPLYLKGKIPQRTLSVMSVRDRTLEKELSLGLRASRKLKPSALCLYVGNGQRKAVEAIDAFYLCLPSGLEIVLNNCHYAPSITRGVISFSRLDGIFEIDLSNSLTNESSVYVVSNKRARLNLDSALLWHCRLGHISKKRIEKLQHDGLLDSSYLTTFEKCVSCMFGKMAMKPYTHQVERAKDLLGLIHTDVSGPFKITSRQGANYFVTYTDDFSRYGYVYLLKHKHEVFETFKAFQKEVENQLDQESSKSLEDLEIIQEEDMHPSLDTSLNHEEDDLEIDEPQSDIVPIRRSTRTRHAPDRMCLYIDAEEHELGDLGELANYKAALLDPESKKWLNAMNVEMQSMKNNEVWVLVELPPNGKIVGSKRFFKKKIDMDGSVHIYKARLVAKGYTENPGIDNEETFSPVANIRAIRILIAIAAYYDYEIWQMDVKTAFLNGYVNEEVYMEQPESFVNPKYPNHVCKLKRLRASRKLKPGALSLYVGNGQREAVEAIGTFYLCLPSGLEIVLNNCHCAPSITRGVISVSRFNKRAKLDLDSALLWHCRLGHISKKRIKKLQHDGLLNSSDLREFEKCVSCMSGKMARKPYTHQVERAKDLLGLIHIDVCGPFKIMSRQGASYFVTFTDDFSRYGYVYLLKHKHEVFETFKVFQKEVENQLDIKDDEKEALLEVFKSHKQAIAWKITDIKGIDPSFCTHKILMEEDYKPTVQSQRHVNLKIHEVTNKEVIKLLDAEMIYLISDSP